LRHPRLYRLLKIHRERVPLGGYCKHLWAPLDCLWVRPQDIMVSFDVVSLFITVLSREVVTLFSYYLEETILRLPPGPDLFQPW
jgi:hypothetical protein